MNKYNRKQPRTTRPCFIIENNRIIKKDIEFDIYLGFANTQKQKSIASFHNEINKIYTYKKYKILEVSTKSEIDLGKKLSAFNLEFPNFSYNTSVEVVFQSSKVFERGKIPEEIFKKGPREIKKIMHSLDLGKLVKFEKDNQEYPMEPKTIFYDWLYIQSLLYFNEKVKNPILNYNIFTDINFNPLKSINCQAYSVAVGILFIKNNISYNDIIDFKKYEKYYSEILKIDNIKQNSFDF